MRDGCEMASEENINEINNGMSEVDLNDRSSGENSNANGQRQSLDLSELPNVLIITNVDESVFDSQEAKEHFESLFLAHDNTATFQYLKSFRRARVTFASSLEAAKARIHLHEMEIANKKIKCYFIQPLTDPDDTGSPHLKLPAPVKQFLISPPASPPVGWEPVHEAEPVLNIDLLSAIANLAPGEAHELHPASEGHPGIVVHICEDPEGFASRPTIQQTRCPARKC